VATGGVAEGQAIAIDLLPDLRGQREFAGDACRLRTSRGRPADAQFVAL
jgi:hypothetical protein